MDELVGDHPTEDFPAIHGNQSLTLESLKVANNSPFDGKAQRQAHYHQCQNRERKDHKAYSDCATLAKVGVIKESPKD